ncbi:methyltransferase domain-containing protein, partial [bacterium]|nr:methyltransferase domain-containing protein [bacterium]
IDISPLAIQKAKELYRDNKNLHFVIHDVADLSIFEDEYFDKAVAMDLVEHIYQDTFERMVQETYRVLKAGGTLSIYTPCKTHLIECLKAKNFILRQDPKHVSVKSMSEIVSTLESFGFKIDMAYFTPSFFPIFRWIELLMQTIPLWGDLFRYRICVRGVKV